MEHVHKLVTEQQIEELDEDAKREETGNKTDC